MPRKPAANGQNIPAKSSADTPKCRYIRSVTLTNVRTFRSQQKLDLCTPDGNLAQWTVILGENGTGKTSLLQYIAGMKPVQDMGRSGRKQSSAAIVPYFSDRQFLNWHFENLSLPREKRKDIASSLELTEPVSTLNEARQAAVVPQGLHRPHAGEWRFCVRFDHKEVGAFRPQLRSSGSGDSSLVDELRIIAYGAGRHVAAPNAQYLTPESRGLDADSPTSTIFYDDLPLISPEQWLLSLHHQASAGDRGARKAARALERAIRCLCSILPGVAGVVIRPYGYPNPVMSVFFETPYGPVPFSGLSLGHRATAAWIVDLVRRLNQWYPDLSKPETGPAVVLIDEFDLHLHIRWQSTIIEWLSEAFPNVQFIVTAHSPVILLAADGRANIALLREEPDESGRQSVTLVNDPPYVKGWRLDQLATSGLYGLLATRSASYQALFERVRDLSRLKKRSPKQSRVLKELLSRLDLEAPPASQSAEEWLDQRLRAAMNGHHATAKLAL